MSNVFEFKPRPYRTAESTIDAFFYVVRLGDEHYLREWLNRHPLDEKYLLQLLVEKNAEKTS